MTGLLGWTPEDIIGRPFTDLAESGDLAAIAAARAQADSGGTGRYRARLRTKAGGARWVAILVRTRRDDIGRPMERYGSWRDAEEAVRRETAADVAAQRRQAVLDGMLDPWVTLTPVRDDTGAVVDFVFADANTRAFEYNRLTREAMIGHSLIELMPAHRGSALLAAYVRVTETGEPLILDDYVYPREIFGGAERHYDIRAVKVADSISLTWRDVTLRFETAQMLAQSQARLSAALDAEIDPHVFFDAVRDANGQVVDLRYADLNPAAEEYIQAPAGRMRGVTLSSIGSPAFIALIHLVGDVIDTGTPLALDGWETLSMHGGAPRFLDVRAVKVLDGASVTWRDVTQDVLSVRELADAHDLFTAAMDGELDGHLICEAVRDADGAITDFRVTRANALGASYFGLSADGIVGQTIRGIAPEEIHERAVAMYAQVVTTGEPLIADAVPGVLKTQRGRLLDIRAVKALDGVSILWRDVTELVHAREAIESSARLLTAAVNSEVDGHLIMDAVRDDSGRIEDFRIRVCNEVAARTFGRATDDMLGANLAGMLLPDARAHRLGMLSDVVETGQPAHERIVAAAGTPAAGRVLDLTVVQALDGVSMTWRDVTELAHAQEALAASEEAYRLLAENTGDMVIVWRDLHPVWVSPNALEALNVDVSQAQDLGIEQMVLPDHVAAFSDALLAAQTASEVTTMTIRARWASGDEHWVDCRIGPFRNVDGVVDGALVAARIADDLVEARRELEYQARFDLLTGLLNRGEVLRTVSRLATRHPRTGQSTAVLFCDIDRFKDINDTYGHAAGDEVLRTLGQRISRTIRSDDHAARIGGDELLVVLTGVHDLEEAVAVAEKIRAAAAEPIALEEGKRISTSLSIGVTLADPAETTDELVERADQAMYDAKQAGRNQVVAITT